MADKRDSVVDFLRRETRLYLLADLIEAGAHRFEKKALHEWLRAQSARQRDGETQDCKVLSFYDK